jgi:hypothetical protein
MSLTPRHNYSISENYLQFSLPPGGRELEGGGFPRLITSPNLSLRGRGTTRLIFTLVGLIPFDVGIFAMDYATNYIQPPSLYRQSGTLLRDCAW